VNYQYCIIPEKLSRPLRFFHHKEHKAHKEKSLCSLCPLWCSFGYGQSRATHDDLKNFEIREEYDGNWIVVEVTKVDQYDNPLRGKFYFTAQIKTKFKANRI